MIHGASRTRLTDLAHEAGVSTATVSRVLNGRPGVSGAARQAVLSALDVLGYERPEKLRGRSVGLVGLLVPDLANPVFPAFAQRIEATLAHAGYTPLLCAQAPGGITEDEYVRTLLEHGVDGLIFVSGLHADAGVDPERYRRLAARGLPLVLVNGWLPDLEATFISADDVAAMDLAVRHLVAQGHKRIGLAVGPQRFTPVARKMAGFETALRTHLGENASAHVASNLFSLEGGAAAAAELLESGHTAIICGSDIMALGAIRTARSRGLRVPEDVSIVGYDDSPLVAFTDPPLTTIRQNVADMGEAAVNALVAEIAGTPGPRAELLFAPELIVRASTAAAPH